MNYTPQLTKEEIKKLYHQLSAAFAARPFDDVMGECRRIIKKYYSCFPLLLQMAVLLTNHHMLAEDKKTQEAILKEAVELCRRIRTESEDLWLAREATSLEAVCYLILQQPQEVLNLLGESIRPVSTDYEIVAQAYQLMGNVTKAKEVMQIGMYQHLLALLGATPSYLLLNAGNSKVTGKFCTGPYLLRQSMIWNTYIRTLWPRSTLAQHRCTVYKVILRNPLTCCRNMQKSAQPASFPLRYMEIFSLTQLMAG